MPLRAAFFDAGNTLVHMRVERMTEAFAAEGIEREGEAIRTAERMQALDSRSARWIARDALRELESDAVRERLRGTRR